MTLLMQYLLARTPTRDNDNTLDVTRREEAMQRFRWAAELAISDHESEKRMGVSQLRLLSKSRHVDADDYPLVEAAIVSALGSKLTGWDTSEQVQTHVVEPDEEAEP